MLFGSFIQFLWGIRIFRIARWDQPEPDHPLKEPPNGRPRKLFLSD
jgi:hypothetical protein